MVSNSLVNIFNEVSAWNNLDLSRSKGYMITTFAIVERIKRKNCNMFKEIRNNILTCLRHAIVDTLSNEMLSLHLT